MVNDRTFTPYRVGQSDPIRLLYQGLSFPVIHRLRKVPKGTSSGETREKRGDSTRIMLTVHVMNFIYREFKLLAEGLAMGFVLEGCKVNGYIPVLIVNCPGSMEKGFESHQCKMCALYTQLNIFLSLGKCSQSWSWIFNHF